MASDLVPVPSALPGLPAELREVAGFVEASLAPATRRAYRTGLVDFGRWCEARGLEALPAAPETVARFAAELATAGRRVSTIEQKIAAIRWAHDRAGHESPTRHAGVRSTLAGIRRELGVAPRRKSAATIERLHAMLAHTGADAKSLRDRAILLLGFAGAFRRSELVALNVEDLERTDRGLLVTVRRSKTDQEAAGQVRAIPTGRDAATCPVGALEAWIEAAQISEGPIFRRVDRHGRIGDRLGARAVALVVKRHAELAGLEAADFAGHSLRAGFVTSAADRGARAERIADHTGHRSLAMIRVYTRRQDAFEGHPGRELL